jgi:surface polysaccharide O-acyltransferase-like enzyme
MDKKRIVYLDVVRVVACLMVIMQHSPMPSLGEDNSVLLSAVSFLTYPCVPLFFMVSGALLLPVEESSLGPLFFIRKRLSKVVFPTLFWTFFYIIVGNQPIGWVNILSIPFSPQDHLILWFMYVLIGLYLISPIISHWLRHASKIELEFYLALWFITLSFTHLEKVLEIYEGYYNSLYYFSGYIGYYLLGYYLHTCNNGGGKLWVVVILLVVPIGIYGICKYLGVPLSFSAYLSLFTAPMSISWFLGIKMLMCKYSLVDNMAHIVERVSSLSFGIYLMHIFLLKEISWKICDYLQLVGISQILLTIFVTFVLSFLFSWVISKLPYSNYLIGFKHKR